MSLKQNCWEQVVISLRTLLEFPVVLGGRTALELQGYAHFLSHEQREVHLFGQKPLPGWMSKLPLDQEFIFHRCRDELIAAREASIEALISNMPADHRQFLVSFEQGEPDWPLLGLEEAYTPCQMRKPSSIPLSPRSPGSVLAESSACFLRYAFTT